VRAFVEAKDGLAFMHIAMVRITVSRIKDETKKEKGETRTKREKEEVLFVILVAKNRIFCTS